jgi:hypothetical protein
MTMTLFNRPQYTRRVIDYLSKCKGIEKYYLLVFIDPGNKEVIDLANSIEFMSKEITINKRRLGCDTNIYNVINSGFQKSDYNIHIEDDICPGRDMLKYFEFCDYRYRYDATVLTVCAYHKARCEEEHEGYYYDKIFRNPWFTPWGWATWKDRWEEIKKQWNFNNAWDIQINNVIRKDRFEIRPHLARAQNIGELAGTHVSPDVFRRDHYNEFWVNSVDCETENFIEI